MCIPKPIYLLLFFSLFLANCTGSRPDDLGIRSGKLKPCPPTPNCVSSMENPSDKEHYMSPVAFSRSVPELIYVIKKSIENRPRTQIIKEEPAYIYFENTSLIMRYVDDSEFFVDEKKKELHFRSASRLGSSDIGVNRKRMSELLEAIQKKE